MFLVVRAACALIQLNVQLMKNIEINSKFINKSVPYDFSSTREFSLFYFMQVASCALVLNGDVLVVHGPLDQSIISLTREVSICRIIHLYLLLK